MGKCRNQEQPVARIMILICLVLLVVPLMGLPGQKNIHIHLYGVSIGGVKTRGVAESEASGNRQPPGPGCYKQCYSDSDCEGVCYECRLVPFTSDRYCV